MSYIEWRDGVIDLWRNKLPGSLDVVEDASEYIATIGHYQLRFLTDDPSGKADSVLVVLEDRSGNGKSFEQRITWAETSSQALVDRVMGHIS